MKIQTDFFQVTHVSSQGHEALWRLLVRRCSRLVLNWCIMYCWVWSSKSYLKSGWEYAAEQWGRIMWKHRVDLEGWTWVWHEARTSKADWFLQDHLIIISRLLCSTSSTRNKLLRSCADSAVSWYRCLGMTSSDSLVCEQPYCFWTQDGPSQQLRQSVACPSQSLLILFHLWSN